MWVSKMSTPANLDVLIEIHVECLVERLAAGGDMKIVQEQVLRGSAYTADDNFP